jgi:hypothetical protein
VKEAPSGSPITHQPTNPTTKTTPVPKRQRPAVLLRGQHVPVLDLHRGPFSQVRYCRGCFALPARDTNLRNERASPRAQRHVRTQARLNMLSLVSAAWVYLA